MPSVHGSCLCHTVEYKITGKPFTFLVCHCKNCKKSSGSALMANAFFKREEVTLLKGGETIRRYYDRETASGEVVIRSFCSQCGSTLFMTGENANYTIVPTGTIDGNIDDWAPRREIFLDHKRPWVTGITLSPKSRSKL